MDSRTKQDLINDAYDIYEFLHFKSSKKQDNASKLLNSFDLTNGDHKDILLYALTQKAILDTEGK